MQHRRVTAVMTTDVVSVREDTSFHEIAETLAARHISAVPVVDDGNHVIGIVSEADLLYKVEYADGDEQHTLFERKAHRLGRYKAAASTAKDLMTTPVVTLATDINVVRAARVLAEAKVKRAPVVDDDGRLAGIVSRGDLLRVFLRSDLAIREEVIEDLSRKMWIGRGEVQVEVHDGVVALSGEVEQKSLVDIVVKLVHAVDGVVEVHAGLSYRIDDEKYSEAHYYRPTV